ncbi:uncharacterized protein VICG_01814 [Vittaforma corneae ATCC 50505]|uniref:Uncharacterized protein n=1 Tax=Vittaforma corneae (strain ATCC 50505) TaxID=993615 RepID=L2GKW2_VITCO|nr:uncharacterized protein VICG_01814 [Vittaforma corneae ATCC 50505]ELA41115.1 hypothetical protein VICG_01814 [Vittaforma corneae ATCC 50505]
MRKANAIKTTKLYFTILLAMQSVLTRDVAATRDLEIPTYSEHYTSDYLFSKQQAFVQQAQQENNDSGYSENEEERSDDLMKIDRTQADIEQNSEEFAQPDRTNTYQRYGGEHPIKRPVSSVIFDFSSLVPYLLIVLGVVARFDTIDIPDLAKNPFLIVSFYMLVSSCLATLLPPLKRIHGIFLPVYINFSILAIGYSMFYFLVHNINAFLSDLQSEKYMDQFSKFLGYFNTSDKDAILHSTHEALENIKSITESIYFQIGIIVLIAIFTFFTLCYFLSFRFSLEKLSLVQIPLLLGLSVYYTYEISKLISQCDSWYCLPFKALRNVNSLINNSWLSRFVNETVKMACEYVFWWMPFLTVLVGVLWIVFMIDMAIWNTVGDRFSTNSDYFGMETMMLRNDFKFAGLQDSKYGSNESFIPIENEPMDKY